MTNMILSLWMVGAVFAAVDGDTVTFGRERIRIANIDTPEIRHAQCDAEKRLGIVAKRRMAELLASGEVVVRRGDPATGRAKDLHGRTLATIFVEGQDVGDIMIAEGVARPWTGKRQPWCG